MPRKDLEGRLPIVYNGRKVEEWYSLYCSALARNNAILEAFKLSMQLSFAEAGASMTNVDDKQQLQNVYNDFQKYSKVL